MPKPVIKKINLNKIIIGGYKLNELSEPNIKFTFSENNSKSYINGDEGQFNRVIINLIKNSIESIYEKRSKNVDFKAKINIDIKQDSDYIYLTILDNGVGFDQIDKVKMPAPYFTTKKKGTGLGLAIVTKIISDHNSFIAFNSINDGAEVKITVPRYYG